MIVEAKQRVQGGGDRPSAQGRFLPSAARRQRLLDNQRLLAKRPVPPSPGHT
jgi:hypothetical protein